VEFREIHMRDIIINPDYKAVVAGNVVRCTKFNALVFNPSNLPEDLNERKALKHFGLTVASNYDQWENKKENKNHLTYMLTLTHAENITDYDESYYLFNKFIKSFNYDILGTKQAQLKYSVVPEQQGRGAWHYHCALYNVPFSLTLWADTMRIWNTSDHKGGAYYSKRKPGGTARNIRDYMVKYIGKSFDERPDTNKKRYSGSQGLKKPLTYLGDEARNIQQYLFDGGAIRIFSKQLNDIEYQEFDLAGNALPSSLTPFPSSPSLA
jgi:hypothetical protein